MGLRDTTCYINWIVCGIDECDSLRGPAHRLCVCFIHRAYNKSGYEHDFSYGADSDCISCSESCRCFFPSASNLFEFSKSTSGRNFSHHSGGRCHWRNWRNDPGSSVLHHTRSEEHTSELQSPYVISY